MGVHARLLALVVGGAVLATALLASGFRSGKDAPSSRTGPRQFVAHTGDRLAYEVRLETQGWVSLEGLERGLLGSFSPRAARGERLPIQVSFEGELDVRVSEHNVDRGASVLEMRLLDARVRSGGEEAATGRALSAPWRLRREADGRLAAITPDGGDGVTATVRALVLGLQVLVPNDGGSRWTGEEASDDGVYDVGYRLVEGPDARGVRRLEKTWYEHRRPGVAGGPVLPVLRHVVRSSGRITVRDGEAWFEDLDCTLEVEERVRDSRIAVLRTVLVARRVEPRPSASDEAGADATPPLAPPLAAPAGAPAARANSQPDVRGMVDLFLARRKGDYVEARDALLSELRADPAAPLGLARYLDEHGESLHPDDELRLWRMLAAVATPAAQEALRLALEGDGVQPRSTEMALRHVGVLRDAGEPIRGALWSLFARSVGSEDAAARGRSTMAILALGAVGHRELAGREVADAVAATLTRALHAAYGRSDEQIMLLSAIGNQGHDPSLRRLEPYMTNADPEIRIAAVAALRRMESGAARDALLLAYAREPDAAVRVAVLGTLSQLPAQEEIVLWARPQLDRESHPDAQAGLVRLLRHRAAGDAELRDALRARLASRPPVAVRAAIYEALRR